MPIYMALGNTQQDKELKSTKQGSYHRADTQETLGLIE